ncbi:MAG TPA: response regulator [Acidimicrobiia bacterium]|nr:response regulator [Acidimicrobiia bacterium]
MQDPQSVLLVEDNPDDVRLIQEVLLGASTDRFLIDRVDRLSSAVEWLRRRSPSVILLDLNLPDSKGLDTLVVLRTHVPRTAIVVLTVRPDDEGPRAIRAGAQDYLPKAPLNGEILARALRYAVERQALVNELQRRHVRELREQDRENLGGWGTVGDLRGGPEVFANATLRQSSRELFRSLVRRYGEVLDTAVTGAPGSLPPRCIEQIEEVARRLGVLNASPSDAIEIHSVALELKERVLDDSALAGVRERGGQVLLELMAAMTDHYRRYAVDLRQIHA